MQLGISQVVNVPESERVLHFAALRAARQQGRGGVLRELERIGPPPYRSLRDERWVNKVSKQLRAPLPHAMTKARWFGLALTAPDFSIFEAPRFVCGLHFSGWSLRDEIYATDLARSVRSVRVPVYFLAGRHDTVISPQPTLRFFDRLRAPAGKQFIWFEESDHWPHLEERVKYASVLRDIKRSHTEFPAAELDEPANRDIRAQSKERAAPVGAVPSVREVESRRNLRGKS